MMVLLLLIFIILTILLINIFWFECITILNSHFGDNISKSEEDNQQIQSNNIISRLYSNEINKISPFHRYIEPYQLPSVDISQLTPNLFLKLTNNFTTPCVIRRFLSNTPAVNKWNLDFFQKNFGEIYLPIINDGSIDKHKDYINNRGETVVEHIKLFDFIKNIKNGIPNYLNNVSGIFGHYPDLLDDMNLEKIYDYTGIDVKNSNDITHMFIGGKGTGTSLHCAISGNFFYNIYGNKKWYLINPIYTRYLSPRLSRTGLFAVSTYDICNANSNDYILKIPRYEVVLNSGDLLFNPPWWWHAVSNISDYTIGCANRFRDLKTALYNNSLYTTVLFSHPILNYRDFYDMGKTKEERNIGYDKALLGDITNKKW